jgi:hypothetical protein
MFAHYFLKWTPLKTITPRSAYKSVRNYFTKRESKRDEKDDFSKITMNSESMSMEIVSSIFVQAVNKVETRTI